MVFSVTCVISVTYHVLRHMLGYTNDQQISSTVSPHDTWRSSALTNIGVSMFDSVTRCIPMLHNGLQVDLNSTQMMLSISMLKNSFPLHTKL